MEKMNCVKRSISLLVAMCMFGGCSLNVIAAQKYENAQDTYAKENGRSLFKWNGL